MTLLSLQLVHFLALSLALAIKQKQYVAQQIFPFILIISIDAENIKHLSANTLPH